MLTFAVNDRDSFQDAIGEWLQRIRERGHKGAKLILVGTKADRPEQRQVSVAEARAAALKMGCRYIETSSKNDVNINLLFSHAVALAVRVAIRDPPPVPVQTLPPSSPASSFSRTVVTVVQDPFSVWSKLAGYVSSIWKALK